MSSTSDTSAIDEKKEEETITDENLPSNIGKFLITLLIIVFILILYVKVPLVSIHLASKKFSVIISL